MEMILQQKYNVKDGVTHRYIIIIVIIRADTKRFTQRQCKKLTSKLSKEKSQVKDPCDS